MVQAQFMEPRAYSHMDRLRLIVGNRLERFPKNIRAWAAEKQKPVKVLAQQYGITETQAVVLQQALFLMYEVGNGQSWLTPKTIPTSAKGWVNTPEVQELRRYNVEHLLLLVLQYQYNTYTSHLLGVGNQDLCLVPNPNDVLRLVHKMDGEAFLLVHNHPDDLASPSSADWQVTESLIQASLETELKFVDHLIIAPSNHWYSMRNNGLWNEIYLFEALED